MRALTVITIFLACFTAAAQAPIPWRIMLGADQRNDEAVKVAVEDLQTCGRVLSLDFQTAGDVMPETGNVLVVGDASRNRCVGSLAASGVEMPERVDHPEGYAIKTVEQNGRRVMIVAGGSVVGDVHGLYWVWDRMRVAQGMPAINTVRSPAMKVRLGAAWGRHGMGGSSREQMRFALRHSFNWVSGPAILDLVPWDSVPEAEANAKNRESARELIGYAHALHMEYFSFANEFTFHPSLLEVTGAALSPCDPKFWDALQEKFRMLFKALPELDGIELCNDDISGFWDAYQPFDVTRDAPECDWSYTKRFNTFVRKVHEVVSGEFGKTYFHMTWGLREHEIHCQPEVFKAVFNDSVPTDNLYAMPKVTRGDRWWHQPYNATFNQKPHETVVLFETMNYYESGAAHLFPTFSGEYFQRGLQTFLAPENSNVRGMAALAGAGRDDWSTTAAHSYILYRLMWNPNDSMDEIARDFCAMHFGPEAAGEMAGIYLLTPTAYQYGLHIEPVSYGQFNSLLHLRVGTFPADGYPAIDRGKEHLAFLRKIYLRCVPWREPTLRALQQGLGTADEMIARFANARTKIKDGTVAEDLANRLTMTRNLIRTNIGYVKVMFAYFDHMDAPTAAHHDALAGAYEELKTARTDFTATPNYKYDLFGLDTLLRNAEDALKDAVAAKERLARIPNRREIEALIAAQQQRYGEVLESQGDKARRLGRFEVLVDGQDMLVVKGDRFDIVNIRWDGAHVQVGELFFPLPEAPGTVVVKDIESRPMHPFVLEQPSPQNGHQVKVYLDDVPGANGWMRFELYWIPEAPERLGLGVPWADAAS